MENLLKKTPPFSNEKGGVNTVNFALLSNNQCSGAAPLRRASSLP